MFSLKDQSFEEIILSITYLYVCLGTHLTHAMIEMDAILVHKCTMGSRHCLYIMYMVRPPITNSTHTRMTFDMYAKLNSHKDHEKGAHTAKSLGKSLLHCTIKHKQSTKRIECQNHSQSSRALNHREVIEITQIKNPHMEQRTSTNIKEGQRGATTHEKISIGKSKL